MRQITFTSLHGTRLQGGVQYDKKFKGCIVSFIKMLGRIYAVTDGYSVCEDPTDTDLKEFEKRVLIEL